MELKQHAVVLWRLVDSAGARLILDTAAVPYASYPTTPRLCDI
jgi:hypothetical protein